MNCAQFDLLAADVAAGRSDAGTTMRAHVAGCAACHARLQAERRLTAALRDLALELRGAEAPAAVAAALRARISGRPATATGSAAQARPAAAPRWQARRWFYAGALAATTLLALGVVMLAATRLEAPPAHAASAAPARARAAPLVATPFYAINATGARVAFPVAGRTPARGLVRVRMPRASLAVFGLPYNHRRATDPITADLLVDTAGAVMALRFVQ